MTSYIEAHEVTKRIGGVTIVDKLDFAIPEGEMIGLLGPNGSGKTTTIRLLNGVIRQDEGTIRIAGLDPQAEGDALRKLCGVVTESAGLYHELMAMQNLQFFGKLYGCMEQKRAEELLELLGLAEHRDQRVGVYSTGMKKRLALAKALLHRPRLLFLDEPTNGLDPEGIQQITDMLREVNQQEGTTVFLCSHVLHQLEGLCGRFLFLEQGRIIEQGTQHELEQVYLKEMRFVVTTGLSDTQAQALKGYAWSRSGPEQLEFVLARREDVSELLRQLLEVSWVTSVVPIGRDLEALYFAIREGRR